MSCLARYDAPDTFVAVNSLAALSLQAFQTSGSFSWGEAAVKVAKSIIKRASALRKYIYLASLDYRNNPSTGQGTSPMLHSLGPELVLSFLPFTHYSVQETSRKPSLILQQARKGSASFGIRGYGAPSTICRQEGVWKISQVIRRLDERSHEVNVETIYCSEIEFI